MPTDRPHEHPEDAEPLAQRSEPEDRPDRIGRYLVLDELGRGGMGVVYSAFDPELSRKIAIKVLHTGAPGSDGDEARARLLREAQALARLSHPNVIQIYDVGSLGRRVYVAMELIEGTTLRSWIDQGEHDWRSVVQTLNLAGRGLAAAHAVELVHRDFKPENVMIGSDGRVVVLDFGLARSLGEPGSGRVAALSDDERLESTSQSIDTPMTQTGIHLGTPRYMAPEQWLGRDIDARTDQFAFCITLYEALYRTRPFEAATATLLGMEVTRGNVKPPPADRDVPRWLRDVVLRGLAPEPDDRHPSMEALLLALAHDPDGVRRRRFVAVGLLAALGVSAWVGSQLRADDSVPCPDDPRLAEVWDQERREEIATAMDGLRMSFATEAWAKAAARIDAYARDWDAQRRSACEATHVQRRQSERALDLRMACLDRSLMALDALLSVLADPDPTAAERAVAAVDELPALQACEDLQRLEARVDLPDDPAARDRIEDVRAQLARARALEFAGDFATARDLARSLHTQAEGLQFAPLQAETGLLLGRLHEEMNERDAAESMLRQAYLTAVAHRHDEVAVSAIARLTDTLINLGGRIEEADATLAQARAEWARAGRAQHEQLLLLSVESRLAASQGDYARAQSVLQEELALSEELGLQDDPRTADVIGNLGMIAMMTGELETAVKHARDALDLRERTLGPEHPAVGRELHNLGSMLAQMHRLDEALPLLERALKIKTARLGENHPDVAFTLVSLANVLKAQGRGEDAVPLYERALAIQERALGADHKDLSFALANLAEHYIEQGQPDRALPLARRALDIDEQAYGPDYPELGYDLAMVGRALRELGRSGEAVPLLERASSLLNPETTDPRMYAQVQFELAQALWDASGPKDRARDLAAAAHATYLQAGPEWTQTTEEIEAWLAAHSR